MTIGSSSLHTARSRPAKSIKVLLVDDSAVVRGLISRWLDAENGIEVVAKAIDGIQGVRFAKEHQPDVVVLDIEMPRMDGLTALPQILKMAPNTKVVMASTLTHRNANITMRALSQGASDYTPKPDAGGLANAEEFRMTLISKIRALGQATPVTRTKVAPIVRKPVAPARAMAPKAIRFVKPDVLFIGSSTGGPQALRELMTAIGRRIDLPIFITQHMPKTFTTVLAEHLTKSAGKKVIEGVDGMPVKPGGVYLAPGGFHMTVRKAGMGVVIQLDQKPPENYCRPSVDPMFRSAAKVYGKRALAIMLTGMGHDGRDGTRDMFDAGCQVIVQDEASSVVWGMPGAVAEAGLAHKIIPLSKIGPNVLRIVQGK
jgi:two-component system chemotaxis response regulator CheB